MFNLQGSAEDPQKHQALESRVSEQDSLQQNYVISDLVHICCKYFLCLLYILAFIFRRGSNFVLGLKANDLYKNVLQNCGILDPKIPYKCHIM